MRRHTHFLSQIIFKLIALKIYTQGLLLRVMKKVSVVTHFIAGSLLALTCTAYAQNMRVAKVLFAPTNTKGESPNGPEYKLSPEQLAHLGYDKIYIKTKAEEVGLVSDLSDQEDLMPTNISATACVYQDRVSLHIVVTVTLPDQSLYPIFGGAFMKRNFLDKSITDILNNCWINKDWAIFPGSIGPELIKMPALASEIRSNKDTYLTQLQSFKPEFLDATGNIQTNERKLLFDVLIQEAQTKLNAIKKASSRRVSISIFESIRPYQQQAPKISDLRNYYSRLLKKLNQLKQKLGKDVIPIMDRQSHSILLFHSRPNNFLEIYAINMSKNLFANLGNETRVADLPTDFESVFGFKCWDKDESSSSGESLPWSDGEEDEG
jgi:hypothetical protein